MPDLARRLAHEADFAAAFARLTARQKQEIIPLLGKPANPANVPASFWEKVRRDNEALALLFLLLIAQDSTADYAAEIFTPQERVRVEGQLAAHAEQFATSRARKLAELLNRTSRARLDRIGSRWVDFETGGVAGEFKPFAREDLDSIFGPERAADVATTETTLADAAGGKGVIDAADSLGVRVRVYWRNDFEDPCEICAPLVGQSMANWEGAAIAAGLPPRVLDWLREHGGPPLHHVCRCYLEIVREHGGPATKGWDPSKHPREPAGSDRGGEFIGGGGKKLPKRDRRYTVYVGGDPLKFKIHPSANTNTEMVVVVDVRKLDTLWRLDSEDYYIPRGGGGAEIKGRREDFIRFLKKGEDIETPRITITPEGTVAFIDGPHRFSVLRDMGAKWIPVTIQKRSFKQAKALLSAADPDGEASAPTPIRRKPGETDGKYATRASAEIADHLGHEERMHLDRYIYDSSKINESLRSGSPPSSDVRESAAAISQAIARLGITGVTLHRGISVSPSQFEDSLAQFRGAEAVTMAGFSSCTVDIRTAKKFADSYATELPIVLKIKARKGLPVEAFSRHSEEKEVILDHNSTFKVESIREITLHGKRGAVVKMTQLPEDQPTEVRKSMPANAAGNPSRAASEAEREGDDAPAETVDPSRARRFVGRMSDLTFHPRS